MMREHGIDNLFLEQYHQSHRSIEAQVVAEAAENHVEGDMMPLAGERSARKVHGRQRRVIRRL